MAEKTKKETYISKSLVQAIDHFLGRMLNEDINIVINIKLKREEGDETS